MKRRDDPYRDVHLEEHIERKIRLGFGQGVLENYKPWLNHFSFSSKGRNFITRGVKVNRLYELFSDLERDYYFLLEYNQQVYDIREQFPLLDRSRAVKIANRLGIRYPVYPYSHTPVVMTTDFYIVLKDGHVCVRTIKPSEELEKKRVLEKFAIEKEYLKTEGINDWKIVTEKSINRVKARNIQLFRGYTRLDNDIYYSGFTRNHIEEDIGKFREIISNNPEIPINEAVQIFDESRVCGAGYSLFKHLLANHKILIDLSKPLDYSRSVQILGGKIVVG